jgi:cytochrome c oxidase subunit 1
MMDDRLGKVHFWTLFFGFHMTFLVQHWLGAEGMPRRYVDYLPSDGFTTLNTVSSIGAFVLGASTLPFFAFMTMLIAVPTGVKFFNWIGTMWRGSLTFETPMVWALGFLVTFLFGGLTGMILGSPPLDWHVSDTYFVVAHFHYVVFGTAVFAFFAGTYFWTLFLGFHLTFLVQHWLGAEGMPRRYVDYLPSDGFTTLNTVSSIGAFVLGASTLPFIYNVWVSFKRGERAPGDDPWGFGNSLEWATSCPPPRHNFVTIPRIRSERPAFDLHYPQAAGKADFHASPETEVTR